MTYFSLYFTEVFLLDFASVCLSDVVDMETFGCNFIVLSVGWEGGEG